MTSVNVDTKRVVLVVEDHPAEREAAVRILASQDFRVETAADYQGAIKFMETKIPALVCLDLTLPRESGFEVCEYMQREPRLRFVPVIIMSDRRLARGHGARRARRSQRVPEEALHAREADQVRGDPARRAPCEPAQRPKIAPERPPVRRAVAHAAPRRTSAVGRGGPRPLTESGCCRPRGRRWPRRSPPRSPRGPARAASLRWKVQQRRRS